MHVAKGKSTRFSWGKVWGLNYKFPKDKVSILYAKLEEPHGQVSTNQATRYYYILAGKGEFVIAGQRALVKTGDVISVPPHTTYDYKPLGPSLEVVLFMEFWDSTKWEK